MNEQIALSIVLCVVGLLAHVSSKWADYRQAHEKVALRTYLFHVAPARTALSVFSAIATIGVLYSMGWLNPGAGAMTGWFANSALDNLNSRLGK